MLAGGPNTIEMPDFKLSSVIISDSDINRPEVEVKEELQVESYAYALKYRSTYSVELTMEKDEIDLFAAFKKELQWYEANNPCAVGRRFDAPIPGQNGVGGKAAGCVD